MSKVAQQRRNSRIIRHRRVRKKIRGTSERPRLAIHRSNKHISLQVIDDESGHTLAAASSVEAAMRNAGIATPADLMAELLGGDRGGEDDIEPHEPVQREKNVARRHEDGAMGDVKDAQRREDEREAHGHEGVIARETEARRKDLRDAQHARAERSSRDLTA